jgi:hypothetical protein
MERELSFVEKNGIIYQFVNETTDMMADKYNYMWLVSNQQPKAYHEVEDLVMLAKAKTFRNRLKCGYQTKLNDSLDKCV